MNKKREGAVILMLLIEAEISWAEREQQCSVNWDTEILHHSAQLSSAGLNTRRTAVCSMFLMQQEINVQWLTAINLPIQLLCKSQFVREWRICWGSHWGTISPCDSGGQSEAFRWSGVSQCRAALFVSNSKFSSILTTPAASHLQFQHSACCRVSIFCPEKLSQLSQDWLTLI